MTREEAQAIYRAGEETVVRVLVELSARVDQLTADFALLKAENIALRERVRTLEGQLAKDSHNSHKPPSSDGLSKPAPKSLRPPSQRPTGGQPGHPGHTLRMVEKPDRTVTHRVERCKACGQSLDTVYPDRIERRQVHDLPEPKLEITEHQGETKTCSCGCVNRAAFPPEAPAPVQYGPRLKGTAVYLSQYQLIPFERTGEILRDLHGCESFSQGTLANFHADCAARLEPVEAAILQQVADSPVAGFDETGVRAAQLQALPDTEKVSLLARYNRIVEEGYAENPRAQPPSAPKRRGRRKQSKSLNLLDRFRDYSPSILAFLHDFAVPFDNNQAERDLRMMKVRQKISGTFRSFDALRRLFLGTSFLPTPNSS